LKKYEVLFSPIIGQLFKAKGRKYEIISTLWTGGHLVNFEFSHVTNPKKKWNMTRVEWDKKQRNKVIEIL